MPEAGALHEDGGVVRDAGFCMKTVVLHVNLVHQILCMKMNLLVVMELCVELVL